MFALRTKEDIILEIKHHWDESTPGEDRITTFKVQIRNIMGDGTSVMFALDGEPYIVFTSVFALIGRDAEVEAAIEGTPAGSLVGDFRRMVASEWPTWQDDLWKLAQIGGKFRGVSGRYANIKFADGTSTRIEIRGTGEAERILNNFADIFTEAAQTVAGMYSGETTTTPTSIYPPAEYTTTITDPTAVRIVPTLKATTDD